jgi:hypothetical protein
MTLNNLGVNKGNLWKKLNDGLKNIFVGPIIDMSQINILEIFNTNVQDAKKLHFCFSELVWY